MSDPAALGGWQYRAKLVNGGWVRIVYADPTANVFVYVHTLENGSQEAKEVTREAFEQLEL